jgi:esterase
MQRHHFTHNGGTLAYLDSGRQGDALVALHSHWMEGLTFAPLAAALAPQWRVIALDQRGHGHSSHTPTYTRADYLGDLSALFDHLGLSNAVLLGNSLGGANAYQFAARHPDKVRALIVEDIGAEIENDTSFALAWEGTFTTKDDLAQRIGPRFLPYLEDSIRQTANGWKLAFEPREMLISQSHLNGNYWQDWLASTCPALLLRGKQSRVTTQEQFEQMAARRPNTQLQYLDGGHVLHQDSPAAFAHAVRAFLKSL